MKNRYVELARHCIGLDRKRTYKRGEKLFYKPYRNYYSTGTNHEDWDLIVDCGYAERGEENSHGGYVYYLNRSGLDWLGNKLQIVIRDEEN